MRWSRLWIGRKKRKERNGAVSGSLLILKVDHIHRSQNSVSFPASYRANLTQGLRSRSLSPNITEIQTLPKMPQISISSRTSVIWKKVLCYSKTILTHTLHTITKHATTYWELGLPLNIFPYQGGIMVSAHFSQDYTKIN